MTQLYWKERLISRQPFFAEGLRVENKTFKSRPKDSWPTAILRSVMYVDYLEWFNNKYIVSYKTIPYYIDDPQRLPQPDDEFLFYVQMSKWLYVYGKEEQTKVYKVKNTMNTQHTWVDVKRRKNFIKLATWDVHVAQFELTTGLRLGNRDYDRAGFVACARELHNRKMFALVQPRVP